MPKAKLEMFQKQFYSNILEQIIELKIITSEVERLKIEAPQDMVDAEFNKIRSQFPNEDSFKSQLSKLKTTKEELIKKISDGLTIRKFIESKVAEVKKLPESEVSKYYESHPEEFKTSEQVKASHILLKIDPKDNEEIKTQKKNRIKELLDKVKSGEDFAELAKNNSECPSKTNGGDLGYFGRGNMVPVFEKAAFDLKPEEVSDIIETQFGYHIIKVTDHKSASKQKFEDVKIELSERLLQKSQQEFFQDWLTEQKKKVVYMNPKKM